MLFLNSEKITAAVFKFVIPVTAARLRLIKDAGGELEERVSGKDE